MSVKQKSGDYEFTHLVAYNIHGQPVGKLINRQRMNEAINHGIGIYAAWSYFGIEGTPNVHEDFGQDKGYYNVYLQPDWSTLTESPPGKGRVAQVICDAFSNSGEKDLINPRAAAATQLKRLDKLGLKLKSAFELEFDVFDEKTLEPFAHDLTWANGVVLETNQGVLLDLIDYLAKGGVPVDSVMTEYGPGQFEFTLDVLEGIKTADSTARFKTLVKSFFKMRGLTSTFMTTPILNGFNCGMHFNFSLWNKDGGNAMKGDGPSGLSDLGRHWLAGLVRHGQAITALSSPTANCYRRIAKPWAPSHSDWGTHDRSKAFRVKPEQVNLYMESRIPSSACNPYLVLAAHVAAGLDGINRKLELPDSSVPPEALPLDLDTALRHLEADDFLVKSLGADLVKHFCYCKRTFELEPLKNLAMSSEENRFKLERRLYYTHA